MRSEISGPGVYPGMPAEQYHGDPAPAADGGSLSSSGATKLVPPGTGAGFDYWRRNGDERTTEALNFGQAAHAHVLTEGAGIVVVEAADWRTNDAKAQRDAALAAGRIPILPKHRRQVEEMARALREHPIAARLLAPDRGAPEVSLFWRHPETGRWCRARPDVLPRTGLGRRYVVPDYKGLSLDTALPTPSGWTTMRAIQVGEQVFGADGTPCTVTAKSEVHWRTCYRLMFDDGSSVICDDEHRWVTTAGRNGDGQREETAVRTTEEIRSTQKLYGQNHHRIALAGPLDLPEAALSVHPYVLGCWLGDGSAASGRISKPDAELFDRIAACGYDVAPSTGDPNGKCPTRTIYGLTIQLRAAGLLGNKHIPAAYLRSSTAQRTALLRGLMDTDGSWNKGRRQAVFTSTDKALALSACELAISLGQRAVVQQVEARGFGLVVEAYRIVFTPREGFNPFSLNRKAAGVSTPARARSHRRVIVAVESMPTVPTQCIAVDSSDNTYLCTEAMIPTHNTAADASAEAFGKASADHGYHQQDPWYCDGIRAVGIDPDPVMLFVVQEKAPPHLVNVVELDGAARELGRRHNAIAARLFDRYTTSGHWPGYGDDVDVAGLPAWILKREGL